MNSWIVTGGIGCGKSSVTDLLAGHLLKDKALIFSADRSAQALLDQPEILVKLKTQLGEASVVNREGREVADREWLRTEVFANEARRQVLEKMLHPGVLAELESARAAQSAAGANLFLAEVPLHYEIGGTVSADLIIVVAASPEVQKRRLMERRGLDESIIDKMLRAQWPIEAKVERANVVIWNDGDRSALEAQVLTLARQHWQA
ncbi:dephospho-CoA kinase [Prosthecobacter algae]